MKQLRFVCAQPAVKYYAWQVEVMLNNFMEMGVNPNFIDIVSQIDDQVPDDWARLAHGYPARFFFYKDTRVTKHYISSIRPNLLKQHWQLHPYLEHSAVFYHDCDIAFTKHINDWIEPHMILDDIWYGSDVRWYIAHSYIIGKGQDVLDAMCKIVNIDPAVVEGNELNSIGAQCILKNINYKFWDQVERDSEILFKDITLLNLEKKAIDPNYHELQIWCSDMWALLWNAWKLGNSTKCHENMNFSWGTSSSEEYHRLNIFHNAGVTNAEMNLFYKALWMSEFPYNQNLNINPDTASKVYYDMIQAVGRKSVLI